jgi:hypothetical protein
MAVNALPAFCALHKPLALTAADCEIIRHCAGAADSGADTKTLKTLPF